MAQSAIEQVLRAHPADGLVVGENARKRQFRN
jgi:hypothetical protein